MDKPRPLLPDATPAEYGGPWDPSAKRYFAIQQVRSDGSRHFLFSPNRGVLYYPARRLAEVHIEEAKRCGGIEPYEIVEILA